MSFRDRLHVAPTESGYREAGYFVWGSSICRVDASTYHLFAARWPVGEDGILGSYETNSRVVRATAEKPTGPYEYAETVLPVRDAWDRYTHNPTIHRAPDGTYVLFYLGMRAGSRRIGVATAPKPTGPWRRPADPIDPVPEEWVPDAANNPAAWIHDDGQVLLLFRGRIGDDYMQIGGAWAPSYEGPYRPISTEPLFVGPEDMYIWRRDGTYHMVAKQTGFQSDGIYARSPDGERWAVVSRAFDRTIPWADGTRTTFGNVDRPQLLVRNGWPTHLAVAVTEPNRDFEAPLAGSRCVVIPLRTPTGVGV